MSRRRMARPRPGDPGNNFARWSPPTKPAEQEGPPIPKHIEDERQRQAWAGIVDDDEEYP